MKATLFILASILLSACNQTHTDMQQLQVKADSLQQQLNKTYKPGLGEFMLGIQMHHSKLWFAGINSNWKLAQFELEEIKETLEDIKVYNTDRPEIKSIDIINPPLENIGKAIQQKDMVEFKSGFTLLTNTCNTCHKDNNHEFNVITIPSSPPVSNQNFEVQK